MARARVTLHEAQIAVVRAHEAVVATKSGCDRAQRLIEEARALRARDGGPDRRRPRPGAVERRKPVASSLRPQPAITVHVEHARPGGSCEAAVKERA